MRFTIPETLEAAKRGSCVPAAIALLPQLVHGRDFVIEGVVQFGKGYWHEHTWVESGGEVFDPTITQFSKFKGYPTCRRRVIRRMSVSEYHNAWRATRSPWWHARLASFGVILPA